MLKSNTQHPEDRQRHAIDATKRPAVIDCGQQNPVRRASRRTNVQAAFALLELLVVMAIIAVLAALILGAVSSAKSRARSAACSNILKQQGLNLLGFLSDYHEYPLYMKNPHINPRSDHQKNAWSTTLQKYAGIEVGLLGGLMTCPAARRPANLPRRQGYAHYGYNMDGLMGTDGVGNLGLGYSVDLGSGAIRPVREEEVENPSQMIAIGDSVIGWGLQMVDGVVKLGRSATESGTTYSARNRVRRRHHGHINTLLSDGHVEAFKIDQLFLSVEREDLSRWNRDNEPHRERLQ